MTPDLSGATELRLRAAVESSPSGLLMTDAKGLIVLVNREVERLLGYPREELLGKPVEMVVPERFRPGHTGFRGGFLAEPRMRAMGAGRDLFGRRKDGSEVPLEIGLTPVATDEGMFVLASIVDITARKAAEEERRRLEDELRQSQKLEAVGTLAGGDRARLQQHPLRYRGVRGSGGEDGDEGAGGGPGRAADGGGAWAGAGRADPGVHPP
jgi:PAS domain S-box-containing protein